jgi:hypothetical protein
MSVFLTIHIREIQIAFPIEHPAWWTAECDRYLPSIEVHMYQRKDKTGRSIFVKFPFRAAGIIHPEMQVHRRLSLSDSAPWSPYFFLMEREREIREQK